MCRLVFPVGDASRRPPGTVDDPDLEAFLGIPDDLELTGVIAFSYPTFDVDDVTGVKDRVPFGEVVHHARVGNPRDLDA